MEIVEPIDIIDVAGRVEIFEQYKNRNAMKYTINVVLHKPLQRNCAPKYHWEILDDKGNKVTDSFEHPFEYLDIHSKEEIETYFFDCYIDAMEDARRYTRENNLEIEE